MKLEVNLHVFLIVGAVSMAGCGKSTSGDSGTGGSGGTLASGGGGSGGLGGKAGAGGTGGSSGTAGTQGGGGAGGAAGVSGTAGATATGGLGGGGAGTGGLAGNSAGGRTGVGGASGTGGTAATGGVTGAAGRGAGGTSGSSGASGSDGGAKDAGSAGDGGRAVATPSFDWVGVVGSGQSLSTGFTPPSLTTAYYNNLMLRESGTSFPGTGTMNPTAPVPGTMAKPWDTTLGDLAMVPLVEPLRAAGSGFPRPYPINLWGETHHGAMAREITHFVTTATPGADYVTVHTVVGESGQGITALNKQTGSTTGDTGRAYAATLFEAGAITRLAKMGGKTYGVGVIVMTHGETDADPPNAAYKDELVQLLSDYNADIAPITGQSYRIPMYISQQHAYPNGSASKGKRPDVNNMQWQLGVDHKGDFVCTGPKYQYPANPNGDGVHLSVTGAELLGEKVAEVYYQRAVLGQDWQPLQPVNVTRNGRVVTVQFHVPVLPLNWDTTFDAPAITEWKNGNGFELFTSTSNVTITSVAISGDSVQITAAADLPTSDLSVGYALTSQGKQLSNHSKAVRWGQLRDSDPFMGTTTKQANPNYAVSFSLPVP
jgi:lysophospholipase L1-like esterase